MDNKQIRFFLSAGEESGDIHGAKLIEAIKTQIPNAKFMGHGGDQMKAAGMTLLEHVNDLAVMGFTEVLKQLPYMLKVMGQTMESLQQYKPHRLVLIDYPGFNLRLAKRVRPFGLPVTYFILPQVWAWKEERIRIIRACMDQALCIFPFEQSWFQARGVNAHFVGHPFTEFKPPTISKNEFFTSHGLDENKPLLVLFPGSRQQEVDRHLPIYKKTVELLNSNQPQVMIGRAPQIKLGSIPSNWKVEQNDTSLCLEYGSAVLTSSGTATLQSAAQDIPAVVSYRMSAGSWFFTKHMSKVQFVAMTNLIAGKKVVPEFLQKDMTPENLARAIKPLLMLSPERKTMLLNYEEVRRTLGIPGAYKRAAEAILARTVY